METKFYVCEVCGKVIGLINDTKIPTMCCGEEMHILIANTSDGAGEKHIPVYEIKENTEIEITVGEIEHPMDEDHYIAWIALVSEGMTTRIQLIPQNSPIVKMKYIKGSTIYSYCNKHGLWKKQVD